MAFYKFKSFTLFFLMALWANVLWVLKFNRFETETDYLLYQLHCSNKRWVEQVLFSDLEDLTGPSFGRNIGTLI